MAAEHRSTGLHLIADLYGIESEKLSNAAAIENLLKCSAEAAGAHIIYSHFHSFGVAQGVTGVVLLSESHISIHTWPEFRFAAADIFMCGNAEPRRSLDFIVSALSPSASRIQSVARGQLPSSG